MKAAMAVVEAFHMASPALLVAVSTVTPILQEVLPMAAAAVVLRPTEGELPTTSSNLHLKAATTLEVARLLEILSTAP
jgi:hypothetical protein